MRNSAMIEPSMNPSNKSNTSCAKSIGNFEDPKENDIDKALGKLSNNSDISFDNNFGKFPVEHEFNAKKLVLGREIYPHFPNTNIINLNDEKSK